MAQFFSFIRNSRQKLLLMLSLTFVCASSTVYGQNSGMVGKWTLDSLKLIEIAEDGTEKQANYDDVKRFITCAFDTIVLGRDNKCQLTAWKMETSATYTFTDDLLAITTEEKENLIYQYSLDGALSLKRRFITTGIMVNEYIVEMKFIKQ
jgi:hypothetical protein